MTNFAPLLKKALEKTGLSMVSVPTGIEWTVEFANLVNLLKLDALKDAEGEYFSVEDLMNVNNIIAVLRGIEQTDVELITGSNLIMTNVNNLAPVVIERAGLSASVTIPAGTDWTKEIVNLIGLVNLQAFHILLEDNAGNIVMNKLQNINTIIEALQSISLDDIHIITDSDLIMANVNVLLPKLIAKYGYDNLITIPAGTDWSEELHRGVRLLQIEEFWNEEKLFDVNKFANIYTLTEALQQLDKEDIEIITASPLFMINFNNTISRVVAASQYGELITIPVGIDWTNEIYHLVELLNIDNFWTDGKFDYTRVLEINNFKGITNSEAKVITSSFLFAANINNIVNYILESRDFGIDVVLPAYINWTNEIVVVSQLLEADAFQDENGMVSLSSFMNIEAYKCLTEEDVDLLTQSTLVMANIDSVVDTMLSKTGLDVSIKLPAYVNWEHELNVFGKVLNMSYFQADGETNKLDFSKMKDLDTYASMKDEDIDVMASSAIFNALLPQVFETMLDRTGYGSSIAIPSYVDWSNELKVIRDVLANEAFHDNDGFAMAKVKNIETFFEVDSEEFKSIAKSAIFNANINTLLNKALDKFGFAGMVIPSYINWEEELVTFVDIIKILDEGVTGKSNSYYLDKFKDINTIKNLTIDDVATLTSSVIVLANAASLFGDKVTEQNSDIIIPNNVEWANRYNKSGELVTEGELWKIVQILNIDAFNGPNGLGSMSMDTLKTIGTEPMTVDSDKSEVDLLMDSQIFSASIDALVRNNINANATAGNEIVVPTNIQWASTFDQNERVIKRGELYHLIKALNIDGIDITNIDKNFLNSLGEDDVNTLTNSQIITSNLHNTIERAFKEGNGLTLPSKDSIVWANSYDVDGNLLEAGELWKLVQIIGLIDVNNVSVNSLQSLSMINGNTTVDGKEAAAINSDLLTSSVIFMANINSMVSKALEAQGVEMPNNIEWTNSYNELGELVEAGELLALIRALNISQFQTGGADSHFDFGKAQSSTVLDELDLSDPEIERAIYDSEIIRRSFSDTIVSAISDAPTTNTLGESIYSNGALNPGEIMALLNAVKVDGLSLSNDLNAINVSTIAGNLDTLLASSIIHSLISEAVIEQDIVTTSILTDSEEDYFIAKIELERLLNALAVVGITNVNDIRSINFNTLLNLSEAQLEESCYSTILRVLYTDLINNDVTSLGLPTPNPYYAESMTVILVDEFGVETRNVIPVYTTEQIVSFIDTCKTILGGF